MNIKDFRSRSNPAYPQRVFNDQSSTDASASRENLVRFRYHTGAQPLRVELDEPCPPLFRDIGPEAMQRFLVGRLRRLCGPVSPITYLRTAEYCEPYVDYGKIGRILLLNPRIVGPWLSGVDCVYIASGKTLVDPSSMVFIPDEIGVVFAAARLSQAKRRDEVAEVIGPAFYRDAIRETYHQLQSLLESQRASEQWLAPLRQRYQSMKPGERERVATWMERHAVTERDLCSAWHHLPIERRGRLSALAQQVAKERLAC